MLHHVPVFLSHPKMLNIIYIMLGIKTDMLSSINMIENIYTMCKRENVYKTFDVRENVLFFSKSKFYLFG